MCSKYLSSRPPDSPAIGAVVWLPITALLLLIGDPQLEGHAEAECANAATCGGFVGSRGGRLVVAGIPRPSIFASIQDASEGPVQVPQCPRDQRNPCSNITSTPHLSGPTSLSLDRCLLRVGTDSYPERGSMDKQTGSFAGSRGQNIIGKGRVYQHRHSPIYYSTRNPGESTKHVPQWLSEWPTLSKAEMPELPSIGDGRRDKKRRYVLQFCSAGGHGACSIF